MDHGLNGFGYNGNGFSGIGKEGVMLFQEEGHSGDVAQAGTRPVDVSFVIPLKDEQESIVELYERISAEFGPETTIEYLFIDDGSTDDSWQVIESLVERDPSRVRGLRFRRNCGKAAALTAGYRAANGKVIFTMDADLQDDPSEIHRFLEKLAEGYDLVSGWKKVRHDPWHKVLPSRVFNRMLSKFSGVNLHDHNCGFKCYRAEVAKALTLHGELHRMVPALSAINGFKSTEIVVQHHPRVHGVSKYGIERFIRGFMDMITVGFLRKYRERPSHFLGAIVAGCTVVGVPTLLAGFVGLFLNPAIGAMGIVAGLIFLQAGLISFVCGLLSEMVIRGGLQTSWTLPIVEDTSRPEGETRPTTLPTSYLAR